MNDYLLCIFLSLFSTSSLNISNLMYNTNNNNNQEKSNMQQTGSGLTRYRSAPSSYFADLLNSNTSGGEFGADDFEQIFNPRASSPEKQRIFPRFTSNSETIQENRSSNIFVQPQSQSQLNLPPRNNNEQLKKRQDYSEMMSHNVVGSDQAPNYVMDNSYTGVLGSHMKIEGGGSEFGGMGNNIGPEAASFSSASRFNIDDFSWDDSTVLSDNFLHELAADNDSKTLMMYEHCDEQNKEGGNRPTTRLLHHLSLPSSSSSELSAMEKLFQDSVPCRIRAKRGFATHPRSIAERVRRTKISERMRKLQELVPNMEKQTSTADMLDLAVDYIKDLQTQVKKLSDNRANCSCSGKGKS
ncbi:hypothetical protein ACJIZ3_011977 [Penstemon smallii]|uniref:BHLH domain-containing protein n=1 Tax=Penstemon smallii TaxID=265156 RepID=A0ABD3UM15_9LAMI